jgi:hypothetical protein
LTSVTIFLKNSVIIYFNKNLENNMKNISSKASKSKSYLEFSAISTRLNDAAYEKFKTTMVALKANHGKSFSVADLIEAVVFLPEDQLSAIIEKYVKAKSFSLDDQMTSISSEARARIEAILAEEAMKKG